MLALQRAAGNAAVAARLQAVAVQRESYDECDATHKEQIQEAHNRAKRLVQITVAKLRVYRGLNPDQPGYAAEFPIRQALLTHFHTTSAAVGRFIADSLVHLLYMCHHVQYECHAGERSGSDYAKTLWCIPFTDISIYQRFFDVSDLDFKAGTLVHEWCHKYLCALDVGYTDDPVREREHRPCPGQRGGLRQPRQELGPG